MYLYIIQAGDKCTFISYRQVVILNCGDVFGETQLLFHHGDENHTRPVSVKFDVAHCH